MSLNQSQSCKHSLGQGITKYITLFVILYAAGSTLLAFFKVPEYVALQSGKLSKAKRVKEDAKLMAHEIIHRDLPFDVSSGKYDNPATDCGRSNRIVLKPFQDPGLFDFHTQVKTNLNILFVGSSVGHQFFKSFEKSANVVKSEVIRYSWGWYHTNTQISLTPDGGTIGVLRVTGMFSRGLKDKPRKMAPQGGGGWLGHDMRELRRMVNEWRPVESISTGFGAATSPCEVDNSNSTHFFNSTANVTSEIIYSCEEKSFDIAVLQVAVSFFDHSEFLISTRIILCLSKNIYRACISLIYNYKSIDRMASKLSRSSCKFRIT